MGGEVRWDFTAQVCITSSNIHTYIHTYIYPNQTSPRRPAARPSPPSPSSDQGPLGGCEGFGSVAVTVAVDGAAAGPGGVVAGSLTVAVTPGWLPGRCDA